MYRKRLVLLIVAMSIVMSCSSLPVYPTVTPPPGWNSPVTELFVDLESLPEGWVIDPQEGEGPVDIRVNNVSRAFFDGDPNSSDKVIQIIWRSYTTADAEKHFTELTNMRWLHGWLPLFPSTSFGPVSQTTYQSKVADQWGLACGIDGMARCWFLARYRNYVTDFYFTLKYDGYEGLSFTQVEKLLAGIDQKFRDRLGLTEITANPSYLAWKPAALDSESGVKMRQLLLENEALPQGWEIAFRDWEDVVVLPSGVYLVSRNYYRSKCYVNSPDLERCYITQFVAWYSHTWEAAQEWQSKHSEINIGEPSQLGVWRVPAGITFSDAGAEQSFVACSEVASGENCEAILRFDNYLIVLIANMQSLTTLMGHSQYGLTHKAFGDLVEKMALRTRAILSSEK